jgi:2-methylcitrate dehydratase PrpD
MKQSAAEYTRELVEFLAHLQSADLPAEVLERARYFLLDYLGVAIRGSREESTAAVHRMIQRLGASGCAAVIGTSIRTEAGLAALANGAAAHAIEMDDTHSGGSFHPGAVMYSAALALAQSDVGTETTEFLTAVIAGYEVAARIAMAVQAKEHYLLGFHPTATCGPFGAAVTASKLLGLSARQMLAAVGIAGSMAAGSMEFLADGAWTKRLHPGLAAQNGIQAALLAAEGFTGPSRILEGRNGFLYGYSRHPLPELLTADLGKGFEILRTSVKPHACCRYMQGPIDAVLELVRRHGIEPAAIRSIEVAVLEAGWPLVAEPREKKYHPESIVDAQFSMPFGAAIAALEGAAGLEQFTPEKIASPTVHKLMGRVVLIKDSRIEKNFPREWRARATIRLEDGLEWETKICYPKGDPENPLSWDELAAKFNSLVGAVLPLGRCRELIERVSTAKPAELAALCA